MTLPGRAGRPYGKLSPTRTGLNATIEPNDARILIVDDEPANVALLKQVLTQNAKSGPVDTP
jgi:PleD family two-component response regulator